VFALFMLLHFSVRVSQLERKVTMLVQEIGLLGRVDPGDDDGHEELEIPELEPKGQQPV